MRSLFFVFILSFFSCSKVQTSIYEKTMPSTKDTTVHLSILAQNELNVFVAFANDCPVCKSAIPTLRTLVDKFPNVGVVLFYPNNPLDSSINTFIESLLPSSILTLKDKNKFFTHRFKAEVTPQVYVLDQEERVVYQGAIDNSVFTNYKKNYSESTSYLLSALDTLINLKKPLENHETRAVGCYIE